jgi:argininosuccinate lyase
MEQIEQEQDDRAADSKSSEDDVHVSIEKRVADGYQRRREN